MLRIRKPDEALVDGSSSSAIAPSAMRRCEEISFDLWKDKVSLCVPSQSRWRKIMRYKPVVDKRPFINTFTYPDYFSWSKCCWLNNIYQDKWAIECHGANCYMSANISLYALPAEYLREANNYLYTPVQFKEWIQQILNERESAYGQCYFRSVSEKYFQVVFPDSQKKLNSSSLRVNNFQEKIKPGSHAYLQSFQVVLAQNVLEVFFNLNGKDVLGIMIEVQTDSLSLKDVWRKVACDVEKIMQSVVYKSDLEGSRRITK